MADDDDKKMADLEKRMEELARSNEGLARKNEELLSEVKDERNKRRAAETEKEQAAEEARAKAEEAAAKSGDVDAVRQQLEAKHAKTLETERKRAEEAEGQLRKLVIDNGIRDAMAKAEVAPALSKGAALAFRDGRDIEIKDGSAFVDGVPLAEAVSTWAGTEDGSAYKAAGQSSGGGAPGGGTSSGKPLAEMGDADRLKLAREGKLKPRIGA